LGRPVAAGVVRPELVVVYGELLPRLREAIDRQDSVAVVGCDGAAAVEGGLTVPNQGRMQHGQLQGGGLSLSRAGRQRAHRRHPVSLLSSASI
jgi:hypothetical protein